MKLSEIIKKYRKEHDLSQRQMGARCGLSTGYISLIEKEINPQTGKVEKTDIEGQTVQVLENLKAVLEAAGCSLEKVVKTTCFLADMKDFARFNEIYGGYFTGKPARSCVAAKELPKGVLVEVEAIGEV